MPASAIASLPFMPILKLIVLTVVVVVVVVVVTCGCGSAQPKSVRVRSASVAFRRSVLIVDLLFGSRPLKQEQGITWYLSPTAG